MGHGEGCKGDLDRKSQMSHVYFEKPICPLS